MAIAIGSLAFWLNQPAYLFNGNASSSVSAHAAPDRNSTPLTHGLLSLELLSAMQRNERRPLPHRGATAVTLCERKPSTPASLAPLQVSAHIPCAERAMAR